MDKCKTRLGYNAVPPPYTGNFMPSKPDLVYSSLDDFVDVNESVSESVVEKPTIDTNEPKSARKENGAPIIKDWVSDSDEKMRLRKTSVDKNRQNTPSPRGNKRNWNQQMSRKLGNDFEMFNKACHVWGSFDHLNNDCNNCPKRSMVPRTVLTRSGPIPLNTARTVNTVQPRTAVNNAGPMKTVILLRTRASTTNLKDNGILTVMIEHMIKGKQHGASCIENLIDLKVKVIRCDNGTEFKNSIMNQFCEMKGIKREFSVARTSQQNRVAKRKNRTLIEATRTMLADLKLPTTFWAEAVNTACYVQNRVLVIKPHNKTPYELFLGRQPALSFMRPFGCPVTILNT
ncbi:ribonuclease H-like domain-containing protein [Tanacetum coccineum]|uniref:Ribonuclease H-like domain-containing protein n=1 Tax=Tanacetum coccineum TaxID=301880 RepID=A0ABQ5FYT4_9ASTR